MPKDKTKHFALVLRTCEKDLKSYGGFQWPEKGHVKCDDWNPEPTCGGGLHGLLWGVGNYSLLSPSSANRLWQVVRVEESTIVHIDGEKCKFPEGEVIYTGNQAGAMTLVLCDKWRIAEIVEKSKTSTSGEYSPSSTSGRYSPSSTSGLSSPSSTSGEYSPSSTSGEYSPSSTSGQYSPSSTSGRSSPSSTSGESSPSSTSGLSSPSRVTGLHSIAAALGYNSIVSAGKTGCIAAAWWDESAARIRLAVGYVGENGIKPNTDYIVKNGVFEEATNA